MGCYVVELGYMRPRRGILESDDILAKDRLPSGRTRDAKGNRHPVRYYGFCVAWLYHNSRPHQALEKNSPTPREIEAPVKGKVIAIPQVGGLHYRYRRAA